METTAEDWRSVLKLEEGISSIGAFNSGVLKVSLHVFI
jgi:hypothetical protein